MSESHHRKLNTSVEIDAAVRTINEGINGCGFDFQEATAECKGSPTLPGEPGQMIVLASFDFCYYHDLELVFYGVTHSTIAPEAWWSDHWTKDQIEFHGMDEETREFEFRFNIDTYDNNKQHIVRAKAFSYDLERKIYKRGS